MKNKLVLLIILLLTTTGYCNTKHILVINSYHPGFDWSDNLNKIFTDRLQQDGQDQQIFIEYLDGINNSSQQYLDLLDKLFREKYHNKDFKINLIIACDDDALKFLDTRPALFGNTPIVFCGINYYEKKNFPNLQNYTGVNEAISVSETVDLALKIRPKAAKMAVISGSSITAKRNLQIFKDNATKFKDRIKITYLTELEPKELVKQLADFGDQDIIVYLAYLATPQGNHFTVPESISLVKNASKAAIFGFWDFLLPQGVIGGKVVHAKSQGEAAADLALRVLNGTPANTIPVKMESPNRFIFNGRVLDDYKISTDSLPRGTIIVNRSAKEFIGEWDQAKTNSFFGYELFAKHGSVMMLIDPVTGIILDANKTAQSFYGYNELIGKNISDINPMPPEQVKLEIEKARTLKKNHFDFTHRLANGTLRNVNTYSYPIEVMGTQVLFSIINDVTDSVNDQKNLKKTNLIIFGIIMFFLFIQLTMILLLYKKNVNLKRAKNEILITRQKLSQAMSIAGLVSWEYDMQKDEFTFNDDFYKLYTTDAADQNGYIMKSADYIRKFVVEDEVPSIVKAVKAENEEGVINNLEHRMIRKDGEIRYISVTFFEKRDKQNNTAKRYGANQDITERKKNEERIIELNANLELKVKQRTAELESFTYSVSHDLRAPLRSIEGFSAILLDNYHEMLDSSGRDYLGRIRKAAIHMSQLIDDFLNLSRVTRQELALNQLDLSRIVKETCETLQKNEPLRSIELTVQPGLIVNGDIGLIKILVNQLLTNAFKFTQKKEKALIRFGLTENEKGSYFFVEDNGTGFDQNYAEKLFKPFQRLHSNEEFAGTGIGLTIAFRIIEKHGGDIYAEGKVDKGACFYFKI